MTTNRPTTKVPFDRIVVEHGATVLRVCRAILGTIDADDAWSETFLSALRSYPKLPVDANVEAWLVTIAHRRAVDAIRASNRRATPYPDVGESTAIAQVPTDEIDLEGLIGRLPEKQRMAVAYHYIAGLRYREVAEILGGSEAAVRRAGADGIAAMRRAAAEYERSDEGA